ncbi:MAG: transcriptional regulator [Bacteroidota bacterium]
METINISESITVMYVAASSFPEGVLAAHQALHAKIPFSTERGYYGLSRPEGGSGIIYKAAAKQMDEQEAANLNLDSVVIKKGNYISELVSDYMKDLNAIGSTFQELLKHPDLDPDGYCIEHYINDKDVRCMIRLRS